MRDPYGTSPLVVPLPVIRVLTDCGARMCAPGTSPLVVPLPVIRVLTDCGARMRAPGTSPLVVPVPEKMQLKMRKAGTRK